MTISLHHFFLLTDQPDELATGISKLGLVEGSSNTHPGQGTANRRFFLPGTTFEILYLRDASEALNGPAAGLRFAERIDQPRAAPFGLVLQAESEPFPGWRYYPEYFANEWFFHVGENSESLEEPLCIVMPPQAGLPDIAPSQQNPGWLMTELILRLPIAEPSPTLQAVSRCKDVSLLLAKPCEMEIVFNDRGQGRTRQSIAGCPLTISW